MVFGCDPVKCERTKQLVRYNKQGLNSAGEAGPPPRFSLGRTWYMETEGVRHGAGGR